MLHRGGTRPVRVRVLLLLLFRSMKKKTPTCPSRLSSLLRCAVSHLVTRTSAVVKRLFSRGGETWGGWGGGGFSPSPRCQASVCIIGRTTLFCSLHFLLFYCTLRLCRFAAQVVNSKKDTIWHEKKTKHTTTESRFWLSGGYLWLHALSRLSSQKEVAAAHLSHTATRKQY